MMMLLTQASMACWRSRRLALASVSSAVRCSTMARTLPAWRASILAQAAAPRLASTPPARTSSEPRWSRNRSGGGGLITICQGWPATLRVRATGGACPPSSSEAGTEGAWPSCTNTSSLGSGRLAAYSRIAPSARACPAAAASTRRFRASEVKPTVV